MNLKRLTVPVFDLEAAVDEQTTHRDQHSGQWEHFHYSKWCSYSIGHCNSFKMLCWPSYNAYQPINSLQYAKDWDIIWCPLRTIQQKHQQWMSRYDAVVTQLLCERHVLHWSRLCECVSHNYYGAGGIECAPDIDQVPDQSAEILLTGGSYRIVVSSTR